MAESTNKATFAAGCFWGVEEAFRKTPGVLETAVGYEGGRVDHPTYKQVCSDQTGHAEVVQVQFDPARISYPQLLELFWKLHDPTTLNRQGPDRGSQYRSAVFYHDDDQRREATAMKQRLDEANAFGRPIVTEITPAATFWRAEEYHQQYVQKNGGGSCHI
jgi:peptide-methionine (S)-S-oxide reductase